MELSDPAFDFDRVVSYFSTIMPIVASAALPGARIVFGSGGARTIPDGVDPIEARARFAQSLVVARDAAAANDLRIMLEPLNRGEANLINSLSEAATFLDEFGITDVALVADLCHIVLVDEPLSTVTELGNRIGHAHITDTGRTPPGQGDWPLAEFVAALRAGGYDGSITIESNFTDFVPELQAALAHVRSIA
jgi:sugar phosphate isomerase/epimerase